LVCGAVTTQKTVRDLNGVATPPFDSCHNPEDRDFNGVAAPPFETQTRDLRKTK